MFCHLPLPYPDELLYSVIARYLILIGTSNSRIVASDIFGRQTKPHVDMPSSLDKVSDHIWPIWHMSGEDIANRLTLFPYYTRYVPEKRVAQCLQVLLSDNGQGIHARLGINGNRTKIPRFLRFCRVCREYDLAKYGETYWHRSHQLPGVLVCPEHGQQLLNTIASIRPKRFSDYADATIIAASTIPNDRYKLDDKESAKALKIAKRCQEMLYGPISFWNASNISSAYTKAAMERGFTEGSLSFSITKLERTLVEFYDISLLTYLGCDIRGSLRGSWIRRIFCKHHRLFPPIQHALIQVFLEDTPISSSRSPFGLGPWKCPNNYARHTEEFPIAKVNIYVTEKGQYAASANCSCGFKFTFLRTRDNDIHTPEVCKRLALGPTWEAEAKRLKKDGLTISAIAKEMGIDRFTVRRLFKRNSIKHQVSAKQINEWRKKWLKLLDEAPAGRRSLVYSKHRTLYKRLRKYDREWLCAQPKRRIGNPRPIEQVNWESRDKKWSRLLQSAADKIRAERPLKRITKNSMITYSGISTSIFAYLNRLPACRSAFIECSESHGAFRERCMKTGEDKR